MSEKSFKTKTVSKGVAQSEAVTLAKTPQTRIRFEPTLHSGGVRGKIIKYKKGASGDWEGLRPSDFKGRSLDSMEKMTVELNTEAMEIFLSSMNSLGAIVEQGIPDGTHDLTVSPKNKTLIVDDWNKLSALKGILDGGYSSDYWEMISKNKPELADKLAAGHFQHVRKETVVELKKRLAGDYSETTGPDSWQRWIFEHNWLFGVNYQKPIEKLKVNIQGVMPDYLFPRIDGFVDVLEIKLPKHPVVKPDPSHPGSYVWSPEANKAIGQVVYYLAEIERQRSEIERLIEKKFGRKVSMLKPKAYILIGNSTEWSSEEREGLQNLNSSLSRIEVLTYEELVFRGEAFLGGPTSEIVSQTEFT